jgi:Uma2 family endonuclease
MKPADFLKFDWPDDQQWELVAATPVLRPSPDFKHQSLQARLVHEWVKWCDINQDYAVVAGMGMLLTKAESVLCPDLMVFKKTDIQGYRSGPLNIVPKVVVEILSRESAPLDHGPKRDIYAFIEVPEYWIVDPVSGALSVFANPKDGAYTQLPADTSGFVRSALMVQRLRVLIDGNGHRVLYL